jgi:hypothetical protein
LAYQLALVPRIATAGYNGGCRHLELLRFEEESKAWNPPAGRHSDQSADLEDTICQNGLEALSASYRSINKYASYMFSKLNRVQKLAFRRCATRNAPS